MRFVAVVALWSTTALAQQHVISTYAGGGPPATSAPGVSAPIGPPISVAEDTAGNAYFAGGYLNRVFKPDSSSGNSAGLAVDSQGNLFIADRFNDRVRRVAPDGIITTVAGNGRRGFSGDGVPAVDAQLNSPWGVSADHSGNLYIVDAFSYRVRKLSANGMISTFAGGGAFAGALRACCLAGGGSKQQPRRVDRGREFRKNCDVYVPTVIRTGFAVAVTSHSRHADQRRRES